MEIIDTGIYPDLSEKDKRVGSNTVSLLSAQIVEHMAKFISILLIARFFGPQIFGTLAQAFSIMMFFFIISRVGMEFIGGRIIARGEGGRDDVFKTLFSIRIISGVIAYILLLAVTFILYGTSTISFLAALYGVCILLYAFAVDWFFFGAEQMRRIAAVRIAGWLLYVSFVYIAVVHLKKIWLIPIAWSLSYLPALFLLVFKDRPSLRKGRFDIKFAKSYFSEAWYLIVVQLMLLAFFEYVIIVVGKIKGSEDAGYISSIFRIIFVVSTFFELFVQSLFPLIARKYKEDLSFFKRIFESLVVLLVFLGFIIFYSMQLISRKIIFLLYGGSFLPAAAALSVMLWYLPLGAGSIVSSNFLLGSNREKRYLWILVMQAVVLVTVVPLVTLKYGIVGTSWVIVVVTGLGTLAFFMALHSELNGLPVKLAVKLLVVGGVSLGVSRAVLGGTFYGGGAVLITYTILSVVLWRREFLFIYYLMMGRIEKDRFEYE